MAMIYVLDTSAILSGKLFEGKLYTTPKVAQEIKPRGHSWRLMEFMVSKGMEIIAPSKESIDTVKKAATKTGDLPFLSPADIEALALAYEMNATLLTDDYSMQNVAEELKIDYKNIIEEGIKEKFHWVFRCKSCGKFFKEFYETCPVCGGKLKRVRKD